MSRYPHTVKIARARHDYYRQAWEWQCPCGILSGPWPRLEHAHAAAMSHAADCRFLHGANWSACCDSCRAFGRPARACMTCRVRRPA